MVVLLLIVLIAAIALGWRLIAAEISPKAANGVLVLVGGLGAAAWLLSQTSW